jgi:hypothetical protein
MLFSVISWFCPTGDGTPEFGRIRFLEEREEHEIFRSDTHDMGLKWLRPMKKDPTLERLEMV